MVGGSGGFSIDGDAQNAWVMAGTFMSRVDIVKDRVGLLNFFFGMVFRTFFSRKPLRFITLRRVLAAGKLRIYLSFLSQQLLADGQDGGIL